MIVHGAGDTAEPIAAGMDSRDKFVDLNACGDSSAAADVPGCVAYAGCSKPLLWCEHAQGHEVPGFVVENLYDFLLSIP